MNVMKIFLCRQIYKICVKRGSGFPVCLWRVCLCYESRTERYVLGVFLRTVKLVSVTSNCALPTGGKDAVRDDDVCGDFPQQAERFTLAPTGVLSQRPRQSQ